MYAISVMVLQQSAKGFVVGFWGFFFGNTVHSGYIAEYI